MSGLTIAGDIGEGDQVEVREASEGSDGVLRTDQVLNRSTAVLVSSSRGVAGLWKLSSAAQGRGLAIVGVVVPVVILLLLGAFLVAVFHAAGGIPGLSGQEPAISLTETSGPPGIFPHRSRQGIPAGRDGQGVAARRSDRGGPGRRRRLVRCSCPDSRDFPLQGAIPADCDRPDQRSPCGRTIHRHVNNRS